VTGNPEQSGLAEATIETVTGIPEPTTIVIMFEVAGLPVAQNTLEVRTHFTWSLLTGSMYSWHCWFLHSLHSPATDMMVPAALVGVAVNVTGELVHSGLAEATIETLTGKLALIDM